MTPVESIGCGAPPIHIQAFAFKRLMQQTIARFLEDNPTSSKKAIAIDLGATSADLSHWLSDRTSYTLPAHLVPRLCRIVGDNSLLWHLLEEYEKGTASTAP